MIRSMRNDGKPMIPGVEDSALRFQRIFLCDAWAGKSFTQGGACHESHLSP
jgi:hypothetical protein